LQNNSPTRLDDNRIDIRTSDYYSTNIAEAISDESDAQPLAEDERSPSYQSLVDSHGRLIKYVEKL